MRNLFCGKSVLTKIVFGNVFLKQSSGMHRYTHSCALTSLVDRKAAPTFPKLSLTLKLEFLASFDAFVIACEHSVSCFVK